MPAAYVLRLIPLAQLANSVEHDATVAAHGLEVVQQLALQLTPGTGREGVEQTAVAVGQLAPKERLAVGDRDVHLAFAHLDVHETGRLQHETGVTEGNHGRQATFALTLLSSAAEQIGVEVPAGGAGPTAGQDTERAARPPAPRVTGRPAGGSRRRPW